MHLARRCTLGMEQATLMLLMFQTLAGLGYIGYMTSSGTIVYSGGNPWDYVKLNPNLMADKKH